MRRRRACFLVFLLVTACSKKGTNAARREFPGARPAVGDATIIDLREELDEKLEKFEKPSEPIRGGVRTLDLSLRLTTVAAPVVLSKGLKAPALPDRVGCTIDVLTGAPAVGAADLACSFRRTSLGGIDQIDVRTREQLDAAAANTIVLESESAGDGVRGYPGHWAIALRLALRLASVAFPPKRELSPGELWVVGEALAIDNVPGGREARFTLVEWTDGGAKVKVDFREAIGPKALSRAAVEVEAIEADGGVAPESLKQIAKLRSDEIEVHGAALQATGELTVDPKRALPHGTLNITGHYTHASGASTWRGTQKGTITFR